MKTIQKANAIALGIYMLFWPLFWLYRKRRKKTFVKRRKEAIRKADNLHDRTGKDGQKKHFHVVQHGRRFYVGSREDFRRMKRWNIKTLRREGLTFDYKKAIIYTAK